MQTLACSICLGKSKVEIISLCDNHYWEWFSEKVYNDARDEYSQYA